MHEGDYYYEGYDESWLNNKNQPYTWVFAAAFIFFIIILFIWGVLAATGDSSGSFFGSNQQNNASQNVFNVTVGKKSRNHPYHGKGSDFGFIINGVHGRTLRLMACKTYTFNVNTPGHPFYLTTSSIGNNNGQESINVTGTPVETGTFTFTVPKDLPQPLYYQCVLHEYMGGRIILSHSDSDMCGSTSSDKNNCNTSSSSSPKRKKKCKGYKKVTDDVSEKSVFYDSD
jgi:hypothetical protein